MFLRWSRRLNYFNRSVVKSELIASAGSFKAFRPHSTKATKLLECGFEFKSRFTVWSTLSLKGNRHSVRLQGGLCMGCILCLVLAKSEDHGLDVKVLTLIKDACGLIANGELEKAETVLRDALHIVKTSPSTSFNMIIEINIQEILGDIAFVLGKLDEAEADFEDALQKAYAAKTALHNDFTIVYVSLMLTRINEEKRKFEEAEEGYRFCLDHLEKHVLDAEPDASLVLWGITMVWYSFFLQSQGRPEDAIANYKRAYQTFAKFYGEEDGQTFIMVRNPMICSFIKDKDCELQMKKVCDDCQTLPEMEEFSSKSIILMLLTMMSAVIFSTFEAMLKLSK